MIDTVNGGQTCQQCRHYREEHIRKDRLFGDLKEADWCIVRGGHIDDIGTGQDCPMFLKRLFTDNPNETH